MQARDLAAFGPIVPVIVVDDPQQAVPLARALLAGGVRVLELTLRTPAALQVIERLVAEVPEAIVGAGTVCEPAQAQAAVQAGSRFLVSPGFDPEIARVAADLGVPLLPGVATASEVMAARRAGLDFLKFFPAVPAGGVPMLKALYGPFPDIAFCPTGGLQPHNVGEFLALPNVLMCGGSWLTPAEAVATADWACIRSLAAGAQALRR